MTKPATLTILLLLAILTAAFAAETLRPEQLTPGMKGYGLSVFKGTKPERFNVEVIGVLKNAFPKQDMILIRMSGADLEKHKVIAGMSGSPIYIDGKLIGALAYGWSFENEPMAGVTPIHNMMAELNRPVRSEPRSTAEWRSQSPLPSGGSYSPKPLLTPLTLGGFSPRVIEEFSAKFAGLGMMPVAAGGAGREPLPRRSDDIEPGNAIGVQLIRGDMDATAVGTATYVEKDRILAFGHPFFRGGTVQAPAVLAEVHTVMSSLAISFKMASPVAEIGAMVGDWQSCIVADGTVQARMVPVSVAVTNRETGQTEQYALEVIDNQALTPMLVVFAITESVTAASSSSQDTTARIVVNTELAGQPPRLISVANTFFNPAGGLLSMDALSPLVAAFNTPFGNPTVQRIDVKVEASLTRQTAEIKRAYFTKSEVERGEHIPLNVVLKPFGQPEIVKTIPIEVPAATDTLRAVFITVVAGANAPPDVAPPDSLDDYLEAIQKGHRNTELVALIQTPTQGLQYRGKLLKKLPASVVGILEDSNTSDVAGDLLQLVEPTDWVLTGQATVRVPIRQE